MSINAIRPTLTSVVTRTSLLILSTWIVHFTTEARKASSACPRVTSEHTPINFTTRLLLTPVILNATGVGGLCLMLATESDKTEEKLTKLGEKGKENYKTLSNKIDQRSKALGDKIARKIGALLVEIDGLTNIFFQIHAQIMVSTNKSSGWFW